MDGRVGASERWGGMQFIHSFDSLYLAYLFISFHFISLSEMTISTMEILDLIKRADTVVARKLGLLSRQLLTVLCFTL